MNKRKILLGIFMFILLPINVYAASINLTCSDNIYVNDEVTCEITGTSNDFYVTSLVAVINTSDNISLISFKSNDKWQGDNSGGKLGLYTSDNIKGNFKIGTITIKGKSSGSGTVSIDHVIFNDEKYSSHDISQVTKNITINNKSNQSSNIPAGGSTQSDNKQNKDDVQKEDNIKDDSDKKEDSDKDDDLVNVSDTITNIIVDSYDFSFNKDVHEYTLTIGSEDSLNITVLSEKDNLEYIISGNENLQDGSVININVFEDDTLQNVIDTYMIKILKKDTATDNSNTNVIRIVFIVIIAILVLINLVRLINKGRGKKNET